MKNISLHASLGLALRVALLPFLITGASAGWTDFEEADVIIGAKTLPSPTSVYRPEDVAVSASGKVYVSDYSYNRVLRYSSAAALGSGQAAEAAFGQPDLYSAGHELGSTGLRGPMGVVVDDAGNLWVADMNNHRILRWANADAAASGAAAVQVLGQPNFGSRSQSSTAEGTNWPSGMDVDSSGRLWVADYGNNRILRYDNAAAKGNGAAADAVIGQTGFGTSDSGLSQTLLDGVSDVEVDSAGRLWAADGFNRRVLRYDAPLVSPIPNGVLGQADFNTSVVVDAPDRTNMVFDIAVTPDGTVFAADRLNYRILRWDNAASKANGASADGVLGRTSLAANSPSSAINGEISNGLRGICVDANGRLFAADHSYERVLYWSNAVGKANGAPADGVIGQSSTALTKFDAVPPANGLTSARSGFEDPVSGKFFIADRGRVLRWSSRVAAENGGVPEAYLGKSNGTSLDGVAYETSIASAWGLAMDPAGNLWVADTNANRVVSFPNAVTAATGSAIGAVLGQASMTGSQAGLAGNRLRTPRGLAIDAGGNLYVCDYGNHRVLRFNSVKDKATNANADAVIGQTDFVTASTAANDALLRNPSGVCVDAHGRLWVADAGKNRVVRYDTPLTLSPLDPPSGFLGGTSNATPTGMAHPTAVVATSNGRVWVADYQFNRVLRFDNAASKPNRPAADGVLGTPGAKIILDNNRTTRIFNRPQGLFLDAREHLWVMDDANSRALKFVPDCSAVIVSSGMNGSGKMTFSYRGVAGATYQIRSSVDLKTWDLEATVNSVDTNVHLFTDTKAGTKRFFRMEEH
jgi:sugar lactone lactonase YvrE